jgi:hypothetical protein
MNITEVFTDILETEKEDEIIPFLKSLDKAQKKGFHPDLKKLYKYYTAFVQQPGTNSYSSKCTPIQRYILGVASFVCYNHKDFEQNYAGGVFDKETMDTILPWYRPDWFSDYVNNHAKNDFVPHSLKYDWYLELVEQGHVLNSIEMIAKILPQSIFTPLAKGYGYTPENLLKREVTLNEHIWYLFDHESNINWSDRYIYLPEETKDGLWIKTFKKYVDDKKLERKRVLKEALSASNKGFNQTLSGWFIELFIQLNPSIAELVELQGELLNSFNSPHSKIINTVLKYLKELAAVPEFFIDEFLENVPLVMSSESKGTIATVLMILDKLAKKNVQYQKQICLIACQAFIHQDDSLQVRAAKLVQKYGDTASASLKESVAAYYDALFLEARGLLGDFSEELSINESTVAYDEPGGETPIFNEIKVPETFDEFVFLASQAFDQNETYHFDLLPAAILRFQGEMTAANILKLAPAFQRAYKLITGDWTSSMGYLDNMLAKFFIDYGLLLVKFYPKEAEPIREMRLLFTKKEEEKKAKWDKYKIRVVGGIKPWEIYTGCLGYKPYKHILLNAFFMLERKIKLPLLSTPTHEPCWILSLTLVERLVLYQEAKVIPGDMDFQVAIARCLKDKREDTLKLANEQLKGEYRQLISFLFGGNYHPVDNYKSKTTWLVAALTREQKQVDKRWFAYSNLTDDYLLCDFNWSSSIQHYTYKQWDNVLRKQVEMPAKRSAIHISFGDKEKTTSAIRNVLNKILPNQKPPELSIYDYIELKYDYISSEHNDIKRLIYLHPLQPELLLSYIISKGLNNPDFIGENDKKLITYTLEALLILNNRHGQMGHLLIATCMINIDKTIRSYAAELWIKGVNENTVQSDVIGEMIGIHEKIELAPLKRFTDVLLANMYQISAKHNYALENLLTECISNMADKPISNVKKLLEIYAEVLSVNKSDMLNSKVLNKLNLWEANAALAKSVQKIKNLRIAN